MRGDVVELRTSRNAVGHEQRGRRFAVIVQDDNLMLSTRLICPTSTSSSDAYWRPEVEILGEKSRVLCEQLICVDIQRLGKLVDRLSLASLQEVDQALKDVLGL